MDYCFLNENRFVQSVEVRASESAPAIKSVVRIHAARLTDLERSLEAVCGYRLQHGKDDLYRDMDWMTQAHRVTRCRRCARELDVASGLEI